MGREAQVSSPLPVGTRACLRVVAWRVAIAVLVLVFCEPSRAVLGQPAAPRAARQSAPEIRKARAEVDALRRQLLQISRLSPLDVLVAVRVVESSLGDRTDVTKYRAEWQLRPTGLIVRGTATKVPDGFFLEIHPHPSVGLTFQDLAPDLLDLPYEVKLRKGHVGEDSLAVVVDALEHVFRVPSGEMYLNVSTSVPAISELKARGEASDTAKDRTVRRNPINSVFFTSIVSDRWTHARTLRELRSRENTAAPKR
jgi:hypothetical protein